MQYGQIVFLLFVAMVFYYAALIFMDFQRAKAAKDAEQENHKEEDIDISEEARSFKPIKINRDEPDSKGQDNAGNPESDKESTDSDGTDKSASKSESSGQVYREAIMTDGILVENIIQEINRLAETGTSDLGPSSSAVRMPDRHTVPLATSVSSAMESFNSIQLWKQ